MCIKALLDSMICEYFLVGSQVKPKSLKKLGHIFFFALKVQMKYKIFSVSVKHSKTVLKAKNLEKRNIFVTF